MRIGIGVTTHNRPQLKALWEDIASLHKYLTVYIHDDVEGKGVAHSKNECLKALKGFDYVFLFDDDCFPIRGFADFFIQAHLKSGEHHFLYMKKGAGFNCVTTEGIQYFTECNGTFMFLTKQAIETVGAFNKDYGRYGFEHAGYSQRVHNAGLTSAPYPCVKGSEKFIFSIDLDFKSSISEIEKQIEIKKNRGNLLKDMLNIFQEL